MRINNGEILEARKYSNGVLLEINCVEHFVSNADVVFENSTRINGYEYKVMEDIEIDLEVVVCLN